MSEVLTPDALRATIAAGQVPQLPQAISGDLRAVVADVIAGLISERDITVAAAAALLGIKSARSARKLAAEFGIKASDAAIARGKAAGYNRGNAIMSAKAQAAHAELDAKVQPLRIAGWTHAQIIAHLGISANALEKACSRLGPLPREARPSRPKPAWQQRREAERAAVKAVREAAQAELVRAITDGLRAGLSQVAVAKKVRVPRTTVARICAKHQLRPAPPPRVLATKQTQAPRQPEPAPPPHKRNPFLTDKQYAALKVQQGVMRARFGKRVNLPPPSREEAERAVAAFLASRTVTVCKPAPEILSPNNFGVGFR